MLKKDSTLKSFEQTFGKKYLSKKSNINKNLLVLSNLSAASASLIFESNYEKITVT